MDGGGGGGGGMGEGDLRLVSHQTPKRREPFFGSGARLTLGHLAL